MQRDANFDKKPVIGLVLLCFCMRAPMSVVGPLVSQVKETLKLSSSFSGLLTTIPLLMFAVIAPLAGRLIARIRVRRLFLLCLLFITGGILLRSYGGLFGLLCGTVCLGFGIGVLNVLIPVWIRHDFTAQIGPVMGTYSTAMTALSALAAGICVGLSGTLGGWQNAMAVFALLPVLAFLFWILTKAADHTITTGGPSGAVFGSAKHFSNWCIAFFMGLQSFLFYVLIAWLPSMLTERGFGESGSGLLMLLFQMVSLITSFLMPVWFQKYPRRRRELACATALTYACGMLSLLLSKSMILPAAGAILFGLGSGMSLSFALTVIAVKGKSSAEAVGLSSFAQCIGYLLAAPAPTVMGGIFDATGGFTVPLFIMLVICLPLGFFGAQAVKGLK